MSGQWRVPHHVPADRNAVRDRWFGYAMSGSHHKVSCDADAVPRDTRDDTVPDGGDALPAGRYAVSGNTGGYEVPGRPDTMPADTCGD